MAPVLLIYHLGLWPPVWLYTTKLIDCLNKNYSAKCRYMEDTSGEPHGFHRNIQQLPVVNLLIFMCLETEDESVLGPGWCYTLQVALPGSTSHQFFTLEMCHWKLSAILLYFLCMHKPPLFLLYVLSMFWKYIIPEWLGTGEIHPILSM